MLQQQICGFRVIILTAILIAILMLYSPWVTADESPSGRRVDVGGYALHIDCQGKGSPTVVLDAGLGGAAVDWSRIQSGLAATTRVCAYDRAGYGESDPGPLPRTSSRIAAELRTLLERVRIPPPYILVGHSFGGYNMRLFASLYPQDTAGLVLVDAPHEKQVDSFLHYYLLGQIDPQGLLQQFWRPERLGELANLDLEPFAPLFGMAPKTLRAILEELAAFNESGRELQAASAQPDIPLVVIMHGRRIFPEGTLGDQLEQQWLELQRELASRYKTSTFIIAKESAHNVLFDQPELVVEAVRKLLASLKSDRGVGIAAESSGSPPKPRETPALVNVLVISIQEVAVADHQVDHRMLVFGLAVSGDSFYQNRRDIGAFGIYRYSLAACINHEIHIFQGYYSQQNGVTQNQRPGKTRTIPELNPDRSDIGYCSAPSVGSRNLPLLHLL